ncbi:MAG: hypothetical protein QOF09_3345 [Alphaproteobacteria bacterium]|nr:hypothetical protein [Alphaproteobacteria bacterium]
MNCSDLKLPRRQLLRLAAGAAALPALARIAWAQAYPSRPIRLILGFAAGGSADIVARLIAQFVSDRLGQPVIVENRTGASSNLAGEAVARAAPDGTTLLFVTTVNAINATFFDNLKFDLKRDFAPVSGVTRVPNVLEINPSVPADNVAEFIAYAKANPGKISFGIQGLGGEMHLSAELFKKTAGIGVTLVPYNAAAQAIVDLLADRLDAMFLVIPPIKQHIEAGKLLALATLSAQRVSVMPNIPTMTELGRPEMTNAIWFGYLAPAKTSDAIVNKLARAFAQMQSDQALTKRVTEMGAELNIVGPSEFGKIIERDRRAYGKIVAEGNLATQN